MLYKIKRKFYISKQFNKDTKKIYMKQKPLTYTFYYWGAFVLDPCMIYKTKSYLFLKICLKIDVNILIHKFVLQN